MSNPRVSIIVPVYDTGPLLDRALRSAEAQTFRDSEIVVVDDGSTDVTTRHLLAAAAARGIVVERTPNRGPAHARNTAVARARGEYVLPLDSDDDILPAFLAKTVPILDANPAVGVVHTWVELVGDHHGVWETGPFGIPALLSRCTIHVSSLYRRRIWHEIGGYDPRFVESCEDWDFWLGAASRGWTGALVPEVLARYRRTGISRELTSRAPGVSTRLMQSLVAKHRPLFETHLEDALGGMYEHLAAAGIALERIYNRPGIRHLVATRTWLRRRGIG